MVISVDLCHPQRATCPLRHLNFRTVAAAAGKVVQVSTLPAAAPCGPQRAFTGFLLPSHRPMPNASPTSPAHSEVPTLHYPSEEECELLDEEEADRLVERRNTDARLITAAPVLLDKLEQACQNMQDMRSGNWEPSDEEFNEVLDDFHSVLTVVTGVNRRNEAQEAYLARQHE